MITHVTHRIAKKPYPHNSDIMRAIKEALSYNPLVSPEEFPDLVRKVLEEKGYYAGLVSDKRVWKLYAEMVKRRQIPNVLNVDILW